MLMISRIASSVLKCRLYNLPLVGFPGFVGFLLALSIVLAAKLPAFALALEVF